MSDEEEAKKPNFPGVWGSGYQAGYADCAAGKPNGGTVMNKKKIAKLRRDLTSVASKIYNCVPKNEPWDKSKIHAEMRRTGQTQNIRVIDGCLNSLVRTGLIKEPKPGCFIQIVPRVGRPPKEDAPSAQLSLVEKTPAVKPKETTMTTETKDPIDIMHGLNAKMDALKSAMADLQTEFDSAALEVTEVMDKASKDLDTLHKLQSLLKGISEDG